MAKAATQTRATRPKASAREPSSRLASRPFAAPQQLESARRAAEPESPSWAAATPSFCFRKLAIQPKLIIGPSDDPLEHEADLVAEQVVRMPDPELSIGTSTLQISRKCASCEEEDEEEDEEEERPR